VKRRQLESSVAVRSLFDRNLRPDARRPYDAVHRAARDRPLALQLESELDEILSRGREVVNYDAHGLHPLDRHVHVGKEPRIDLRCLAPDNLDHRSSDITFREPIR